MTTIIIFYLQREIRTCSAKTKGSIIEIITLLGLGLDELIIEPVPIKTRLSYGEQKISFDRRATPPVGGARTSSARPILKEDQLLLSITAPLAKDDLMPENTISKRPAPQGQQRLLSIFSTLPEGKNSWDSLIKEGTDINIPIVE